MGTGSAEPSCFEYPPHLWTPVDPIREGWESREDEPMGSKEKNWVRDPAGISWLLKFARQKSGEVRGEDWAECVVHALAGLVGIPTACVRPATCDDRRAIVSRSVLRPGERLEHGNELLATHDVSYAQSQPRENPGYTVGAVRAVLFGTEAPTMATAPWGAFGVWAGYLMLDAWVAGRDRHHENWAVARTQDSVRLVESFDHGNALGFAEPEGRLERLASPGEVEKWCEQGVSPHFAGRPSLVDVACQALVLADGGTATYWVTRLRDVAVSDVRSILSSVPAELMSEPRRTFVERILDVNRERIIDAFSA